MRKIKIANLQMSAITDNTAWLILKQDTSLV